jgi:hypothetical protein
MIILVPKLEQELFRLLTDARTTNELAGESPPPPPAIDMFHFAL